MFSWLFEIFTPGTCNDSSQADMDYSLFSPSSVSTYEDSGREYCDIGGDRHEVVQRYSDGSMQVRNSEGGLFCDYIKDVDSDGNVSRH